MSGCSWILTHVLNATLMASVIIDIWYDQHLWRSQRTLASGVSPEKSQKSNWNFSLQLLKCATCVRWKANIMFSKIMIGSIPWWCVNWLGIQSMLYLYNFVSSLIMEYLMRWANRWHFTEFDDLFTLFHWSHLFRWFHWFRWPCWFHCCGIWAPSSRNNKT